MPKYAVKQLYLPEGSDWGVHIKRYIPQIRGGQSLLIWSADGVCGFLAADPKRDLISAHWLALLARAVADELLSLEEAYGDGGANNAQAGK